MPALTTLEITSSRIHEVGVAEEWIYLLYSRSGSTLTHLSVDGIKFGNGGITRILGHLPALESLRTALTHIAYTDEIFLALRYRETSSVSSQDVIIDMILSRWWSDEELTNVHPAVSRWKRIALAWRKKTIFDQAQLAQLVRCREEGLDVCVHGMPTAGLRAQ